jgi:hypothetical protein
MTSSTAVRLLTQTDGLRSRMLTMNAPAAIACPHCGAPAGHECLSKHGNRPLSYHAARRKKVSALGDVSCLQLLCEVYSRLAQGTGESSVWSVKAKIIRDLLDEGEQL